LTVFQFVIAYDFITLLVENMRVSMSKEKEPMNWVSEKAISTLHNMLDCFDRPQY
jgi:hypothetical protein